MTSQIIDGKAAAEKLRLNVAEHVADLLDKTGIVPGLAVILVGEDPASQVYVRNKARKTKEAGMTSFEYRLDARVSEEKLLDLVDKLNSDPQVHGILIQLPLPGHINSNKVINAVHPSKDVDGFHISNAGLLATGQKAIIPCTPLGCVLLLRESLGTLSGLEALVVGKSNIVGKPMAQLLLSEGCTVTVAHSKTRDLPSICKRADILVAAVGRAEMIKGDWLKPGATVIDVGINRIERDGRSRLVGDVDLSSAVTVSRAITPVPGGVGPMTIACLLANTLVAALRSRGLPEPIDLIA